MSYTFTPNELASYRRAVVELAHRGHVTIDLSVVDYGRDHERVGCAERYGLRDSRHVKLYNLIPIFGDWIKESKRWYSSVGEVDDFGRPVGDTVVDGRTCQGPWALMSKESWKLEGGTDGLLGQGYGQAYRLRPDGVWINFEEGKTHKGSI